MRQQNGNVKWVEHHRRGERADAHGLTFRDVQWEDGPSDPLRFRFTLKA